MSVLRILQLRKVILTCMLSIVRGNFGIVERQIARLISMENRGCAVTGGRICKRASCDLVVPSPFCRGKGVAGER